MKLFIIWIRTPCPVFPLEREKERETHLRSKTLTLPSALTLAKTPAPPHAKS